MNAPQNADDIPPTTRPREVKAEIIDEEREAIVQQVELLAWLLDEAFTIPGLKIRVGVDGLLGLFPVVGDFISAGLSMYIVACAHSLGVPRSVLMRMSANTAVDLAVGSVPLVGDAFDVGWKANRRNVNLLKEHLQYPQKVRRRSQMFLIIVILGLLALAGGSIALIVWLVATMF